MAVRFSFSRIVLVTGAILVLLAAVAHADEETSAENGEAETEEGDAETTEEGDAETEEGSDGGGGIGNFPGLKQITSLVADGGLVTRLTSEACDNPLPEECKEALKDYPTMFRKIITMEFDGLDLGPICEACNPDDVVAFMGTMMDGMATNEDDPFCDGALIDPIAGEAFNTLVKILVSSTCVKNEDDKLCWSEVLPSAVGTSGITEIMGSIDFTDLNPAALTGLLATVDTTAICKSLEEGGCCSSLMLDTFQALTKLTCISTPMIDSAITATAAICGMTPGPCPEYSMEDYAKPDGCPPFQEWIEKISQLNSIPDTSFAGCTTEGCPKNDCEFYMCSISEA